MMPALPSMLISQICLSEPLSVSGMRISEKKGTKKITEGQPLTLLDRTF